MPGGHGFVVYERVDGYRLAQGVRRSHRGYRRRIYVDRGGMSSVQSEVIRRERRVSGQEGILRGIRRARRRAGRGGIRPRRTRAGAEEVGRVGHLDRREGRNLGQVDRGGLGSHDETAAASFMEVSRGSRRAWASALSEGARGLSWGADWRKTGARGNHVESGLDESPASLRLRTTLG